MLQLKEITKVYGSGDTAVKALNGVSLAFRRSEFVSILGQSGCGKTTLLNIVGGLDHYTDGDLIINGKSTKNFKDRDWDTYRNHTIGFVFQSYNLIPHQSVLNNVELALTLSGVPKAERRKRAKAALEKVGLGNQLRKKPSQLSGGQMQRVAIARALVNDPDIILADEPTGALDTETSVQVMDLLKEVAKDRLVIMVTHNPELAEEYSTRIIRMLDGVVVDDSAPLTEEENHSIAEKQTGKEETSERGRREKKPSMKLHTAFGLSLKNLFTKKGRTILTAFAGSIGIIGIALISAVSNGMTTYIDTVQEETLSSYPLTLEATHTDMGSLIASFMESAESYGNHELDAVYQKNSLYNLVNSLNNMKTTENDLKTFKKYLEEQMANTSEDNALRDAINGIQYGYDLNLLIYTEAVDGQIIQSDTQKLLTDLMIKHLDVDMSGMMNMGESYGFGDMMTMGGSKLWQEILPGNNGELINPLLHEQYELIDGGRWPAAYNEIVLVVDKNNELDDMSLYALGLKSEEEMNALAAASKEHKEIEIPETSWTYEEIRNMDFRAVLPFNCYSQYKEGDMKGLYYDLREVENDLEKQTNMLDLYENALKLKVTGIVRLKEDAMAGMLSGKICYTSALTQHVINEAANAPVVIAQNANPEIDIFTGKPFKSESTTMTEGAFAEYLNGLDDATKVLMWKAYVLDMPAEELKAAVDAQMKDVSIEQMKATLTAAYAQAGEEMLAYLESLDEESLKATYRSMLEQQAKAQHKATKAAEYTAKSNADVLAELDSALSGLTDEQRMNLFKAAEFISYVNKLDTVGMANTFVDIKVADQKTQQIQQIATMSRDSLLGMIREMSGEQGEETLKMMESLSEEKLRDLCIAAIRSGSDEQIKKTVEGMLAQQQSLTTPAQKADALKYEMQSYAASQFIDYYDNALDFSESTYKDNLSILGNLDLESPATINIYASSFENKDIIEAAIADYNEGKPELEQIVYTDYVGLMMSSITTIIDAITYVLIAFVAISLIVSSIMIGVITLISVQERTKEIGILRAIGASKRNVSSMFNAETVIIGFTAGALGVLITYLLCIPINLILNYLTDIANLKAILPVEVALILVGISVLLTLFAGIIPSRSAAKKDPVVALRTE